MDHTTERQINRKIALLLGYKAFFDNSPGNYRDGWNFKLPDGRNSNSCAATEEELWEYHSPDFTSSFSDASGLYILIDGKAVYPVVWKTSGDRWDETWKAAYPIGTSIDLSSGCEETDPAAVIALAWIGMRESGYDGAESWSS